MMSKLKKECHFFGILKHFNLDYEKPLVLNSFFLLILKKMVQTLKTQIRVNGQDLNTIVWKDNLDWKIVQGIWLGSWSKAPIEQLKFIEN